MDIKFVPVKLLDSVEWRESPYIINYMFNFHMAILNSEHK